MIKLKFDFEVFTAKYLIGFIILSLLCYSYAHCQTEVCQSSMKN